MTEKHSGVNECQICFIYWLQLKLAQGRKKLQKTDAVAAGSGKLKIGLFPCRSGSRDITEDVSVLSPSLCFSEGMALSSSSTDSLYPSERRNCCPWSLPVFQLSNMKSNAFPPTLSRELHREFSD